MSEKAIKHAMNEVEIPAGAEVEINVDLETYALWLEFGGIIVRLDRGLRSMKIRNDREGLSKVNFTYEGMVEEEEASNGNENLRG